MQITARELVFDVQAGGPQDGPQALLLHGFPQHAGEWDLVASRLHDAGVRTYAPDQRGYSPGARPTDVDAYAISELVADAVALLDALGVNRAHVVGHDWGAVVAWHLAAEHPDRVRTLTAISVPHPSAYAAALATDPDQQRRSSYIGLFQQEGTAEDMLLEHDGQRLRAMFTGIPAERLDGFVTPMLDRARLTGALNWYRALGRGPMTAGAVSVPTTFIWSDQDLAVGAAAAEGCAQQVTGDYRFVTVAGASHWIPDEAPDEVAREILARMATA
jgi:pimeloyl-ACP methyl ester carboxylesterase